MPVLLNFSPLSLCGKQASKTIAIKNKLFRQLLLHSSVCTLPHLKWVFLGVKEENGGSERRHRESGAQAARLVIPGLGFAPGRSKQKQQRGEERKNYAHCGGKDRVRLNSCL
jgi:hypothetical protein